MKKKLISILLCAGMVISLAGCGETGKEGKAENEAKKGETLTIYTNSGSDGRGEWLEEKAKEAGFDIQFIDAGAAETQSRLIAEKNAPVADVVFGLNSIIWSSLKSEDILTEYVPKWAGEVESELNDPDGFYHATVKQAILLCYDENQISEEEAPKDWPDLWQKEEFHGKYEYLTGLSGGTVRNVLAGILTRYADPEGELGISDEGWKEIESYYKNGSPNESGVDLYARIADTNNPIICGQMWSSGIESRDEQYGTKTAYAVPEVGVPYAVEAIGIVNGTKKLDEAKEFVDWFGSAEVQGQWAEEFSTLPANEKAVDKANEFNQEIAKIPAQDIDWDLVAENIDAWCEKIILEYMP